MTQIRYHNSFCCFLFFILVCSRPAIGEFTPPVITIQAPSVVDFSKGNATFDFTLNGSSATVWLVIYTKDLGDFIPRITNGYMNWHTISGVDTLVYVSPGVKFTEGNHTIVWDGVDKNGVSAPVMNYNYYIIAIDQSGSIPAAPVGGTWIDGMQIIETDTDGSPLEKPLLYESRYNGFTIKRFELGNDPASPYESFSLDQSTDKMIGDIAVEPEDHDVIYYQTLNKVAKIRLHSGKNAELITNWGTNGIIENITDVTTADFVACCGVEIFGEYVAFSHNNDNDPQVSELVFVNRSDGSEAFRLNLTDYYVVENYRKTGNFTGVAGPFSFTFDGADLYTTSFHSPRLLRMDAMTGDLIWLNDNGDYFGDKFNLDMDPSFVGAAEDTYYGYYYHVDIDRYGLCYYPDNLAELKGSDYKCTGFILGPDGSGILKWMVNDQPNGSNRFDIQVIDSGGPYDGLYMNGIHAATDFVPYRVFAGQIISETPSQVNDQKLPNVLALNQNTPNPFNPSTSITYSIPEGNSGRVSIKVYDLRGALVRTLVDQYSNPGMYSEQWDGTDNFGNNVSSGIYIYQLQAGEYKKSNKMILMR